jgi:hypothetical protein
MKGMAGIIFWEKELQFRDEPMLGGHKTSGSEPQLGVEREQVVTRMKVSEEGGVGVGG